MNFKALIFDLDGTLLDSMYIWDTIAEDYLDSIGIKAKPGLCEAVNTLMMEDSAEYLKKEYKLPYSSQEIFEAINKIAEDFYFYTARLKEGAADFLQLMRKKNIKMCIATASERYVTEAALKRCGVFDCFEKIFTCSEVGYSKTTPHIYNEALRYLQTDKSEVLVFEDALFAARTAKNAGFKVCGVFDKSEKSICELKNTVDFYIKNFKTAGEYFD